MAKMQMEKRSTSERAQNHAKLLETALARPRVREVMQVFGGWREKDRALLMCTVPRKSSPKGSRRKTLRAPADQ